MKFQIVPIPKGSKRGWKVLVDGDEVQACMVELVSERHGRLVYGLRPEGYDGWAYYEPGGGGGATVPFVRHPDYGLLIGLVRESRPNMGDGPVFNLIGGFVDSGEKHAAAADREREEETGITGAQSIELEGAPANSNRAFWVTDLDKDEGLHVRGVELPHTMLELCGETMVFQLKEGHGIDMKKAADVRFFRWKDAVRTTPDALARAAIAQLLAQVL